MSDASGDEMIGPDVLDAAVQRAELATGDGTGFMGVFSLLHRVGITLLDLIRQARRCVDERDRADRAEAENARLRAALLNVEAECQRRKWRYEDASDAIAALESIARQAHGARLGRVGGESRNG